MKILVLGGTGAIGEDLIKILSSENEVFVTSRSKRNNSDNLTFIQGNAKDNNFLQNLLRDQYDVVVDFMSYSTDEFALRYNLFLNSTDQYVFLSSSRVYAKSSEPITENSPRLLDVCKDEDYLNTDEYALAKARQENFILDSGSTNWTIIRPYITYNDNRLQLGIFEKELWLYRALKGKSIIFSCDVADKMTTMTYGYDVAVCLSKIIGNLTAKGEIINVLQSRSIVWNDVLNIYLNIFDELGIERPSVVMLESSERYGEATGRKWQLKYDRLYDRVFDNSKLLSFLPENYSFTEVSVGLEQCLDKFYFSKGKFQQNNWHFEAFADKVSNESTSLKEIQTAKDKVRYILYRYFNFRGLHKYE